MDEDSLAKRVKIEENRCKALEKLRKKMLESQGKQLQKIESPLPEMMIGQKAFELPQRSVQLSSIDAYRGNQSNTSNAISNQSATNCLSQYNSKYFKPMINDNQRGIDILQAKPFNSSEINSNEISKTVLSSVPSKTNELQSINPEAKQSIEVDLELLSSCQVKITPINTNSRNFILQNFPKRSFPTNRPAILVQLNDFLKIIAASMTVKKALKLMPSMEKCFIEVTRYNALPEPQKQIKDASLAEFATFNSLLPFQMEGVMFGISRGGRLLLADDMGLGKTLQAAAISFFYRAEWPLLVICPACLTGSWKEALQQCYSPFSIEIKAFWDSKELVAVKELESNQCVFLVSYDLAAKNCPKLRELALKVVIVDECHMLKNKDSKRTKSLAPFLGSTCRLILLSGTPALSRPIELFPQLQLVNSRLFSN